MAVPADTWLRTTEAVWRMPWVRAMSRAVFTLAGFRMARRHSGAPADEIPLSSVPGEMQE